MMVRGQFAQLMAPGLHDIFMHWSDTKQRALEYTYWMNVENSDKAYEDEVEFSGLPPMQTKPEGDAIVYADAIQGGTYRYTPVVYALGVRSSWELYKDDQYNLINQVPKALARSAQFVQEQKAANVLNNGFTTQLNIDGLALFSNVHPLLGGAAATNIGPGLTNVIGSAGTYPNEPATDVDLSFTAIQLAVNQFERLVDSQGMPISMKPRYLIIPPELKFIAREILGSPHKPYTADNEINALLSEDLEFFVSHYLTSQSAWFLLCEKSSHSLKFLWREQLDEDFSDDFDTRSIKQVSFMRFAVGATSWVGTWGSNGP